VFTPTRLSQPWPGKMGGVAAAGDSRQQRARLSYDASLAAAALAYALLHHLGSLPQGLGDAPRGTRWVDWLDLLTPYLVLAAAAVALRVAGAAERTWWLFALGAVAYASGHGIHLAANSVANTAPGLTAHLWDEIVGHLLWYAGVALVVAALAGTTIGRPRPRGLMPYALALAVGLTWATNALGGDGTAIPGLLLALVAAAFGWPRRAGLPILLVFAGGIAALVLAVALLLNLSS
jgi:hypothetical protein